MNLTRREGSSSHRGGMPRGAENPQTGLTPQSTGAQLEKHQAKRVNHRLPNGRHLGTENQVVWSSLASEPLSTRFWKGLLSGAVRSRQYGKPTLDSKNVCWPSIPRRSQSGIHKNVIVHVLGATEDSPLASYSLRHNGNLFPNREQASRARGFGKSGSDLASSVF